MIFWLGFLFGTLAGFIVAIAYAGWAHRGLERIVDEQSKALGLWRRGWVPRDWHGVDRLAKSEAEKAKEAR